MENKKEELAAALTHLRWLLTGLRTGGLEGWLVRPESTAPPEAVGPQREPRVDPAPVAAEAMDSNAALLRIRQELGECVRCRLHEARTHIVFGEGAPEARLVFVGEGPGFDEDRRGKPFIGRAGKLLEKMICALGLRREDVYICNVVKCRPPGNRTPNPDEIATCSPFLMSQLEAIRPRVICALGGVAAQTILGSTRPISALRGKTHLWRGIPLVATFHPAYLLRNPASKAATWLDLLEVQKLLTAKAGEK